MNREPATLLFCLPHAGGTTAAYRGWDRALEPEVIVVPIQPPTYDDAASGPMTDLPAVAEALADRLMSFTHRPYAFFGHSLGGIIAFETIRRLVRRGCDPPHRLFVCGCQVPPIEAAAGQNLHELPDDLFLERVGTLGGLPREVRDEPELRQAFLPGLRADYLLAETYEYRPGPPLPCPISVLCGRSDALIDHDQLDRWRDFTEDRTSVRTFPGTHFLLQSSAPYLHRAIRKDLSGRAPLAAARTRS